MRQKTKLYILFPLIVLMGFLRDYLFENVNWIYLHKTEGRRNQALHEFDGLLDWSVSELYYLKFGLTFLFFILFGILTYVIIRVGFEQKLYRRISIILYTILLAISGLAYVLGILFASHYYEFYAILITFMHLGESFVPCMILFILFKFFPNSPAE